MTRKVYNLISYCVAGAESIAAGLIFYFVEDGGIAAAINTAVIAICTTAMDLCAKFIKD